MRNTKWSLLLVTVQETETTKSYGRRRLQQTWQDARSQWPALMACGILATAFAVGRIVRLLRRAGGRYVALRPDCGQQRPRRLLYAPLQADVRADLREGAFRRRSAL